jgi:hypothetical protein
MSASKKKITLEIAAKVASANGPLNAVLAISVDLITLIAL